MCMYAVRWAGLSLLARIGLIVCRTGYCGAYKASNQVVLAATKRAASSCADVPLLHCRKSTTIAESVRTPRSETRTGNSSPRQTGCISLRSMVAAQYITIIKVHYAIWFRKSRVGTPACREMVCVQGKAGVCSYCITAYNACDRCVIALHCEANESAPYTETSSCVSAILSTKQLERRINTDPQQTQLSRIVSYPYRIGN